MKRVSSLHFQWNIISPNEQRDDKRKKNDNNAQSYPKNQWSKIQIRSSKANETKWNLFGWLWTNNANLEHKFIENKFIRTTQTVKNVFEFQYIGNETLLLLLPQISQHHRHSCTHDVGIVLLRTSKREGSRMRWEREGGEIGRKGVQRRAEGDCERDWPSISCAFFWSQFSSQSMNWCCVFGRWCVGCTKSLAKWLGAMCINYRDSMRDRIKRVKKKTFTHSHTLCWQHISLTNLVNASSGQPSGRHARVKWASQHKSR